MDALDASKLTELVALHGRELEDFVAKGRIPESRIGNFYGRHPIRQQAIVRGMKDGLAYSMAEQQSAGEFDTKRWSKVRDRSASARGLLLRSLASITADSAVGVLTDGIQQTACELHDAAVALATNLSVVTASEYQSKKRREPKLVEPTEVTARSLDSRLRTALTKLNKTVRDVPKMPQLLDTRPSVNLIAATLAECARIVQGSEILRSLLVQSPSATPKPYRYDAWGVGREYCYHFRRLHPLEDRRIATHKKPDADALVSAWMVDRYLFPDMTCRIKFIEKKKLHYATTAVPTK